MRIRTFIGLTDYVDGCVNEFIRTVDVVEIQTHATGKDSITVTVIYREVVGDGR